MALHPIAIFGDWHGAAAGWGVTAVRSAAREGARHGIHVGDFGLEYPGKARGRAEAKLNRRLVELGMTLWLSPGNHDNHDYIASLNEREDGTREARSNIRVLPFGSRTMIEGLRIGALGGAYSIDAGYRREGFDWWAKEEPSEGEAKELVSGGSVDVLVSHDAPAGVPVKSTITLRSEILERANKTRMLLADVVRELEPPLLVCGHYHQRLIHELKHPGGGVTQVHVLDMENSRAGNGILVWPDTLKVEPLFIKGI